MTTRTKLRRPYFGAKDDEYHFYVNLTRDEYNLWLKALTGKIKNSQGKPYRQTTNLLCDSTGAMCCLGVLADVTRPAEWCLFKKDINDQCIGTVERPDRLWTGDEYWALRDKSQWRAIMYGQDVLGEYLTDRLSEINDQSDGFEPIVDFIKEFVHPIGDEPTEDVIHEVATM